MPKAHDAFVSDLLCTHSGDPANAQYLEPISDPEQEATARLMADASFSGYDFADDVTQAQADRVWEQCLIDARRMLCDEDYERIFTE